METAMPTKAMPRTADVARSHNGAKAETTNEVVAVPNKIEPSDPRAIAMLVLALNDRIVA